jgi:serine/threonine-protein kinase
MVDAGAWAGRLPQLAKYEIREEIGRGGMATVYRAVDKRLGREVAVKLIHPHLRDSAEVASRFQTEATAVAKLRHPNIVEVYDVSSADEPQQYLVVELVRGTTLRRILQQHDALPAEIAAGLAVVLLDALQHAHSSGVVHRDIKPENVLVEHRPPVAGGDRQDGACRVTVKLTDFGIAKLLDAQGVTSTGQVLGSPAHMSPEQIEGGEVDARADIFGLGVLFYECLVGHLPFEGANPAQVLRRVLDGQYPAAQHVRPTVGARWSAIVDQALAHSREDRFGSASAMREALVRELARLGFWPSLPEVEAWLDDPAGYVAAYRPRLVERLRERADEGRKRGDSLGAAADYNRALANAPGDPQLLRMVARMSLAEAWGRAMGRLGLALAALVVTGVVGVGLARLRRAPTPPRPAVVVPTSVSLPQAPEPVDPSAAPTLAITAAEAASAAPEPALRRRPREVVAPPPPHPVDRQLTLDLTPPMGLTVAVDDQPARSVSTGDELTVDSRAHVLSFACSVCSPVRLAIAPGEKEQTVVVAVPVMPATLVIDGRLGSTYQVVQHPELLVRVGVNSVALKSAFERITIREMETGASLAVRLEAGKTIRAAFPP